MVAGPFTPGSPPTATPLRHPRGYGHRVLIASLFLPDTIQFRERDESIIQTPRDQSSAPPSPTTDPAMTLALHELGNRLQGVNVRDDGPSPSALSDTEEGNALSPPQQKVKASQTASKGLSPQPPRRGSSGNSGTSSGHALQPTPQVNMSSLMAEATRPPTNEEIPRRRLSSSLSGASRPAGLSALTPAEPTPSSSVADHGRSEFQPPSRPQASRANTNATVRGGSSGPEMSTSPPTTTISLAAPGPPSRRGSVSAEGGSTSAKSALGLNSSSGAASSSSPVPQSSIDGTGTRTPGASVAGKAGTLQPLSIISDLQARRNQMSSLAPTSTPGDAERHHPFGGGAVTPLRGSQTPGHAPRPPGAGPHGSQTPGLGKSAHSASVSRPQPPSLTMTKSTHDGPPQQQQQQQQRGNTSGSGAVTTGTSTPHLPSMKRRGSDAGGYFAPRPALSRIGTHTNSSTTQGRAGGTYNDHGRGAALSDAPEDSVTSPPAAPQAAGDGPSSSTQPAPRAPKKVVVSCASGETTPSTGTNSPVMERVPLHRSGRKQSTGSSSFVRSSSRPRLGGSGAGGSGSNARRSSTYSSLRSRRLSSDTLSTFTEDVGVGDESPEHYASHYHGHHGHHSRHHTDGEEDVELPPWDFITNPSSNGGLFNAISALADQRKLRGPRGGKVFVGTPSIHADEEWLSARHRRGIAQRYRNEKASVPVWVKGDIFRGAYGEFCKGILWPTFHYTLPSDKSLENEHSAFEAYRHLNELFARKIAEEWKEGDIVLINDYHLLLVPQMLRDLVPSATIGLFVHIAFPSSELFRCLAMRETLLRGMLGADLVGFQTLNFCRHFRQTVSRILQLEATPKGVQTETLFTTVSSFPIGIDPRNLNAKRADPEVTEWVQRLTERYEGKKVTVGRDKMDWIRGVRQKLLAFEVFLNEHPEWVGRVVLIQVALATNNEDNDEAGEANNVVSRINSKYSSLTYQPVVFLHVQDITTAQYLALLTVADAFLANSLREGMNLTTHEYIICQEAKQSPLILSEFTGTYSALRASIGINPWNTKQVAHAMHTALSMGREEARARWADLHRTVVTQTALQWITSLLSRLERAHLEQQRRDNAFLPRLEVGTIVSEYRAAKTRLIVVDLEGSLLPGEGALFLRDAKDFCVPHRVLQTLRELTEDPRNFIYVLSGLSAGLLDKLTDAVPGLGVVSEDGCAIKHPEAIAPRSQQSTGSTTDPEHGREGEQHSDASLAISAESCKSSWTNLTAGLNNSWKSSVTQILRYFSDRTPGSILIDRGSSLFFSTTDGRGREEGEETCIEKEPSHATRARRRSSSHRSQHTRSPSPTASPCGQWAVPHSGVAHDLNAQESQWARRQLAEINNLIYDSLGFSLRIIPKGSTLSVMPKNVSRVGAVQHVVQLQAMGLLNRGRAAKEGDADEEEELRTQAQDGTRAFEHDNASSSTAQMLSSARLDALGLGGGGLGSAKWDHWHDGTLATGHHQAAGSSTANEQPRLAAGPIPTPAALAGSFDLCLYLGRDERVMAYCSSLDLPFAPLTVTSAPESEVEVRGSEAGFCLGEGDRQDAAEEDGEEQDGATLVEKTLRELAGFRRRDERWGTGGRADE
ncbi:hypothetical protein BDZ90DRAFT_46818 [Jaminaea rosea]|uniref:Uncharacterized protein n=1 Tax=Jaminaea rosea TaxID=1569628 RepID=A0A316USS5_9BASI|nr:hypothetical protein BDZ90DRAFT_46818 [Jaminaea rosea]PWN26185.1 hypothetical protein BDZ90DRAFT_46818 [Jaminaea rosea]